MEGLKSYYAQCVGGVRVCSSALVTRLHSTTKAAMRPPVAFYQVAFGTDSPCKKRWCVQHMPCTGLVFCFNKKKLGGLGPQVQPTLFPQFLPTFDSLVRRLLAFGFRRLLAFEFHRLWTFSLTDFWPFADFRPLSSDEILPTVVHRVLQTLGPQVPQLLAEGEPRGV